MSARPGSSPIRRAARFLAFVAWVPALFFIASVASDVAGGACNGSTAVYAHAVPVVCEGSLKNVGYWPLLVTLVLVAVVAAAIFCGLPRRAFTVGGALVALGVGSLVLFTQVRDLNLADPPAEIVAASVAAGVTSLAAILHRVPVGKLDAVAPIRIAASTLSAVVLAAVVLGAAFLGFGALVVVVAAGFASPFTVPVVLCAMLLPGVLLWRRSGSTGPGADPQQSADDR